VEDVRHLELDLPGRSLVVWHAGEPRAVLALLARLNLGARPVESAETDEAALPAAAFDGKSETRALWAVLAINAAMFVVEGVVGWIAESTGLLADGLDMLADALVYAVALLAVGRGPALKRRGGAAVWRPSARARGGRPRRGRAPGPFRQRSRAAAHDLRLPPGPGANVTSLWIVARHREGGLHLKATYICTTNDVFANLGVIAAGALVAWTGSPVPDLVIGTAIAALVLRGALRILRL